MTAEDSLALLLDIGFSRDDWTKFKSVTDEHLKPANMSLFPSNTHIQHATVCDTILHFQVEKRGSWDENVTIFTFKIGE